MIRRPKEVQMEPEQPHDPHLEPISRPEIEHPLRTGVSGSGGAGGSAGAFTTTTTTRPPDAPDAPLPNNPDPWRFVPHPADNVVKGDQRPEVYVILNGVKHHIVHQTFLSGGAVNGFEVARGDVALGPGGQRDDVVPDDADADVVKVVVREVGDVPPGFRQGMALVAVRLRVEQLPAAPGGITNRVLVPGD